MSPSDRRLRQSPEKFLCIAIASMTLTGCGSSTKLSRPEPNPLLTVSCPELTPLTDASFGATTIKLIEVAGLYYRCRAAALGLDGVAGGSTAKGGDD